MPTNRGQSQRVVDASIAEIREMYGRAQALDGYEGELGSFKVEAFLSLATLLEGVLTQLGLLLLQRDADLPSLRSKRKNRYGLDNAIDDLYLMKVISTADYDALNRFKNDRNRCMHELFRGKRDADFQAFAGGLFVKHRRIFDAMFGKLLNEVK